MFHLYNADCLEKMKDISSNSIDLILCDLPFGIITGGCSWDVKIDLEKFWEQIKRIRKNDHTPTIHFCTTKYGYDLIKSNEDEFRYDLVWSKPNAVGFLSANKMPMRSHEMIYVFSKKGAQYQRIDISGDFPCSVKEGHQRSSNQSVYGNEYISMSHDNTGKRCPKSVLSFSNKKAKGAHPTAKPLELYRFLIERYCPVGGVVFDPTFGSGNSGLAAKELKRNYIGIEKDKSFYDKFSDKIDKIK